MAIDKITKVEAVALVTEALLLTTVVKQPMWLRVATLGSLSVNTLAYAVNAPKSVKAVLATADLTVSALRTRNAYKTGQFKKEMLIGLVTTIPMVAETSYLEYLKNKQVLSA